MTIGRFGITALWVIGLAACLLTASAAVAKQPATTDARTEAEHEALRQLRAIYEGAIRDGRLENLAPYLADDFHGVMVTGRVVNGLGELKQYWSDIHQLMGNGGKYTTTLTPDLSVILGDVALARGTSADVVTTDTGQQYRFTSMWTAVLQKQDGRWKLRQAQGTIDPVDNPFVREFRRRALQVAVAISGVIGLVLGGLVLWFMRRRQARA